MLRKKTPIGKLEEQPNVHPAQEKVEMYWETRRNLLFTRTLCLSTREVSIPRQERLEGQGDIYSPSKCHFKFNLITTEAQSRPAMETGRGRAE